MIFPDREIPRHVWDLEAENFAWIDFFGSTMGRSGEAGHDIELIYEKMQDKEQLKNLLSNLTHSLAKTYNLPGWGDKIEKGKIKNENMYSACGQTDAGRYLAVLFIDKQTREGLIATARGKTILPLKKNYLPVWISWLI